MHRVRHFVCVVAWLVSSALVMASPYRGVVTFGGLPLPGATVTAQQGTKTLTAIADANGAFAFDDLADGKWAIDIVMQCFVPIHADVTIAPNMPAAAYELKLLDTAQIQVGAQAAQPTREAPPPASMVAQANQPQPNESRKPAQGNSQSGPQEIPKTPEENEQGADGFLVQGSVNNAATSQYATNAAFGNTRSGSRGLYTGGFTVIESNSALNAQPYTLSGVPAAKPSYNNFTGVAVLQGPLRIPHLLPRGPNVYFQYTWTRNSSSIINTGLVPTAGEEGLGADGVPLGYADLSSLCSTGFNGSGICTTASQQIYNPATGQPYANNHIPIAPSSASYVPGDVSPQAQALLRLYPRANIPEVSQYNYQAPVLNSSHTDSLNARFDKYLPRVGSLSGGFALQGVRSDNVNLFGFVDRTGTLGINSNMNWSHYFRRRIFLNASYTFSRLRTEVTPNYADTTNISGQAGIGGNDQDPADWGPPALSFSDGTFGLSDGNSLFNRDQTNGIRVSVGIYRNKHNVSAGGEFRKQSYNDSFQQNPRGTFTFTGAATQGACSSATVCGSALADFLVGIPDSSAIAFGNANKYLREPVYSAYVNDDWRVLPILTINAGVHWDYSAPISELFGNLVNLDVANGFTAVGPVEGYNPVGPVTGNRYPASLMEPERRMFEPRIGVSWRPIPASTVVLRAGYGIYPDTSVYQNIVLNMVQQAPISTSLNVSNTTCPLTLAKGFPTSSSCTSVTQNTFGIDPHFRIGYAQVWKLEVQRDLPFALQVDLSYTGTKGTHGPQEILPNSYPLGMANPCPNCTSGFVYETSNGNSIREEGQLRLRRRLRSGFAAALTYAFAKSIDDDAYLGGQGHTLGSSTQSASLSMPSAGIAQNWLNPRAERSLSSFDQRQLLNVTAQYTSGQGLEGGTLLGGWRGKALKEWTVTGNLTYGTGLPETPLYSVIVPGTGFNNVIRPDLTGAPIYRSGSNTHLNTAAYSEPLGGWGTAGRYSIAGPNQFTFNNQLARTFRPHGKWYLDIAVNSTNTFNHVAFTNWNNYVTSSQFGLPASAGAMRSLQTTIHVRWQ